MMVDSDRLMADRREVRKILVRAVNWLGDAVMTTPALGAIRASFPNAHITLLANPLVARMFTPHEAVDQVVVYDKQGVHAGLAGRLKLAAQLRGGGFDLAILLQNAFDAALIAWLARIPRRIGYKSDGRGLLLTRGVAVTAAARQLHHVDYYLTMLAACAPLGVLTPTVPTAGPTAQPTTAPSVVMTVASAYPTYRASGLPWAPRLPVSEQVLRDDLKEERVTGARRPFRR